MPGFLSQDGKTTLSSEVICLIWNTQASTNWRHCFTFSEGLVDDWVKGVTSFLSYYKITLSIGLASGTERVTYRFNPACRLCRIKKKVLYLLDVFCWLLSGIIREFTQ